jgi:hypothetical protein
MSLTARIFNQTSRCAMPFAMCLIAMKRGATLLDLSSVSAALVQFYKSDTDVIIYVGATLTSPRFGIQDDSHKDGF